MTERVQPGAQGSIGDNLEMGEALGVGGRKVQRGNRPSISAQQDANLDETALQAFDINWSGSSFDVTVLPGEAFIGGWVATDEQYTVTVAASTIGQEIAVGWNPSATYDSGTHASRDEADDVIVDLASNFPADAPKMVVWSVDTDGSGVTTVDDRRSWSVERAHLPSPGQSTVTHSSDTTEGGYVTCQDYTVESGVTVTVNGMLVVVASGDITIEGTVDASGQGGSGGGTSTGPTSDDGGPGGSGFILPIGAGGSGGTNGNPGGDGGNGDTGLFPLIHTLEVAPHLQITREMLNAGTMAAGGGGGGDGSDSDAHRNGGNGSPPGGGGAGGTVDMNSVGNMSVSGGATGGAGGGLVMLVAGGEIEVTAGALITAAGLDGNSASDADGAAGGGGGGGTGGYIGITGSEVTLGDTEDNLFDVSKGLGGTGGNAQYGDGGDGADGHDGVVEVFRL